MLYKLNGYSFYLLAICTGGTLSADDIDKNENVDDDSSEIVVVSAYREPFLSETPNSIAAINITIDDSMTTSQSLLGMIGNTLGVSANGQGGLFQSYSIRGSAKHRVRTLVEGIPVVTERRAGVSASFIDPSLYQSIDVIRGPVSTFYGSGALGGAVNIFISNAAQTKASFGFQNQSHDFYSSYIYGDEDLILGFSHRDIGKTEAANGDKLNDAYNLTNFYYRQIWQTDTTEYQLLWLETDAKDIGKSNKRFNISRNTIYPVETHRIIKLSAQDEAGWLASFYVHPNELKTQNDNLAGNLIRSQNESFDFGGTWQQSIDRENSKDEPEQTVINSQWGIDWFSRRNVEANEIKFDPQRLLTDSNNIIDGGELDDLAFFMSMNINVEQLEWHLGARYNLQKSSVYSSEKITDKVFSSFVGFKWQIVENWQFFGNLATGFRFPTISERFFTGNTARGEIIGAVDLETERSLNLDLGLQWSQEQSSVTLQSFHMNVDDFIERITLESGQQSYANLDRGTIKGIELAYQFNDQAHQFDITYSNYTGKDNNNNWLADIPANIVNLGYQFEIQQWKLSLNWQHRQSKSDVGDSESTSDAYDNVSLKLVYTISNNWSVDLALSNAFDALYVASNDDLDAFATGRMFALAFHWNQ